MKTEIQVWNQWIAAFKTHRCRASPKCCSLHKARRLQNYTRHEALNFSVSNCSVWKWICNLMIYSCSLGLMSAPLHHNGCVMAEESILQDQEHPRVQPVFLHDVPIFHDDNVHTYCTLYYTAERLKCTIAIHIFSSVNEWIGICWYVYNVASRLLYKKCIICLD